MGYSISYTSSIFQDLKNRISHVALFTNSAANSDFDNNDLTHEYSGNGYARAAADFEIDTNRSIPELTNSTEVLFPAPSGGSWLNIRYFVLLDSATGGNIIAYEPVQQFNVSGRTKILLKPGAIRIR